MNWKNVDLNSSYERDQKILDPYTFDTLLLEVACNVKEINNASVMAQAMEELNAKHKCAMEVLSNNIDNITAMAQKERNS